MDIICLIFLCMQACALIFMFLGYQFLGGNVEHSSFTLFAIWSALNLICAAIGVYYDGASIRKVRYVAIISNSMFWLFLYVIIIKMFS